ncbi:TM0106 family RecB-like putative nuclease, partial [Flavobacteriaceae bacterium]|nr:TM0106 family RecB-like putative nuclease [Flavobacteriaceae bacterium]
TTFLGCHHASFLDVKNLSEDLDKKEADSTNKLLQEKGIEHEKAYLQKLKDEGKSVCEIDQDSDVNDRVAKTNEAIKHGYDVIYQAVLKNDNWQGFADFLIKCDKPSNLGNHSYEVLDTKLGKKCEAKYIIQLCLYSDLLSKITGNISENIHLYLGDKKQHSFKLAEFFAYFQKCKNRFEDYIKNLEQDSYPKPCGHCKLCSWRENCTQIWQNDNHLSLIANINNAQIEKLEKAQIKTIEDLANFKESKIPDLNPEILSRLKSQAILQNHQRKTGENKFEIINFTSGKGFDRLPQQNEGDLFFDMEGDPLYDGGLEYLFGVYYFENASGNDVPIFKAFWGHNLKEERQAFKDFMDFIHNHLSKFPSAYIYHYNHYETTALKRLSCKFGLYEERLDNLLRAEKFVDLYVLIKEAIRTSEEGYSIKNLETFYMEKRQGEVATATDSIVVYNQWQKTGDDNLLKQIMDYNEIDCISTKLLRDWLLKLRPESSNWFEPRKGKEELMLDRKDWEIEYESYQDLLGIDPDNFDENANLVNVQIANLLEFHNRENKPVWWAMFERQNKADDELLDDNGAMSGLTKFGEPVPEKRSLIYSYNFPPQEFKLKAGSNVKNCHNLDEKVGTIFEIDEENLILKIKSTNKDLTDNLSISSGGPIDSKVIRKALYKIADKYIHQKEQKDICFEILSRALPRFHNKQSGEEIIDKSKNIIDESLKAISDLDHSYLFIQGPPGAGKTYTTSHIIARLLKSGKRIGISSNSHKAIDNLLAKIEEVALQENINFNGIKKDANDDAFEGEFIKKYKGKTSDIDFANNSLFAGTAWLFSDESLIDQLDYLFIDEAGQVALANIASISNSAKNLILVGDQMQLGQPIQGTHPGEAGKSILEFLLQEESTIASNRGIFLGKSYRMRPEICDFISKSFYDGRLKSDNSTALRKLELQNSDLPNQGIHIIHANHQNCSQKSIEEGRIIKNKYQELLGQEFTDKDGIKRQITIDDMLVVSPYNVQVNYLTSILPKGAKVGTVDKFQGQESPIVMVSFATSSYEDLPRNIEFLYSKNRLNVAISRAQCLAVVVMNPNLMEANPKSIKQMGLLNGFCNLVNN